ncbi:MAG TPA: hypothetical protein H9823_02495, partial [Candidatus Rubneribacter avistercoris]|nr:hypothetical protein [Candidatus Rubneribacter avistercoris]
MKESGHGSNNDEASAHVRAKERSLSQALCRGAAKRRSKGRLLRGGEIAVDQLIEADSDDKYQVVMYTKDA